MRTIVDIPDDLINDLTELCAREKKSRSALIRKAISEYLKTHTAIKFDEAFGIWKKKAVNAMRFEKKLRSEWER